METNKANEIKNTIKNLLLKFDNKDKFTFKNIRSVQPEFIKIFWNIKN